MDKPFGPKELRLIEHNPWTGVLVMAPMLMCLFAAFSGARDLAVGAFIAAGIAMLHVSSTKPWARRRSAVVTADAEGLRVGERHLARAGIRAAHVIPANARMPARVRVVPVGARPSIEIEVADVAQGRRLLRAIGQDTAQTT